MLLAKRFEISSFGIELPEGLVALSVPAQDINTVGGEIVKGSNVDVYAVGTSITCLERNIGALAMSNTDEASTEQKINWATLAINPTKIQEFASATKKLKNTLHCRDPRNLMTKIPKTKSHETITCEALYRAAISVMLSA